MKDSIYGCAVRPQIANRTLNAIQNASVFLKLLKIEIAMDCTIVSRSRSMLLSLRSFEYKKLRKDMTN